MEKEADNYFNQGYTYYEEGEPEKALEHYQEALEILKATKNYDKVANIFLEMGNSYAAIEDCDKSLKMYQSCYEYYQKAKNHLGEGYALANMGVVQSRLGNYQEARDSYKKSIKKLKKSGDGSIKEIESLLKETYHLQKKDAENFYEKAIRLHDKGGYKEALGFYKKALNLFTDKTSRGDCLLEMGNIQAVLKNDDKALDLYQKSQKEYHGPKDRLGEGFALSNMGVIHDKRKEYEEARYYYQKALYKFEKIGDRESYNEISALMGETYEVQGAYGDALKHHEAHLEQFPAEHQADIHKQIDSIKDKLSRVKPTRKESLILLSYLLILIGAEVVTTYTNVEVGLLLHTFILFGLLINSSLSTNYSFANLLRSMMALPMIRIVGLSIPILNIPALYWFPIISIPLFAASVVIIRSQKLTLKSVGLVWGKLSLQLVVALTGVVLGLIEYMILRPDPLIPVFNPYYLLLGASFIIISTGLAEELLFRGIIQKNAENIFGGLMSAFYVSLLFTSLHIGWESLLDLIFVFSVSMFYGFVFYKTRSIFGITLSHGISNSFLFLVFPFLL